MVLRTFNARELVFDVVQDAVLVVDGGGRVVDRNRAGAALLAAVESADVGAAGTDGRHPALDPVLFGAIPDGEGPGSGDEGPEVEVGERTFESSIIPVVDERGEVIGRAIVLRDVTRRVRAERLLKTLATTDELTRVPNRRHFLELAGRALAQARRTQRPLAWLAVDVDALAGVNERHGRATGDLVLQSVAAIASASIRAGDLLARTGDDAFTLCLPDTTVEGAGTVAERLRRLVVNLRVAARGTDVQVTVSVGAFVQSGGADRDASRDAGGDADRDAGTEAAMVRAEEARERAAHAGGDRVEFVGGASPPPASGA